MIEHVKKYHQTDISKSDSVKCEKCESEFSCHRILDAHYYFKHRYVRFCCYICGHLAENHENFVKHKRKAHTTTSHPNIKYDQKIRNNCAECDWSGTRTDYRKHWDKSHPDVPLPFLCHMCDYSTVLSRNLSGHIRMIHTKEKNIKCDLCNFTVSLYSQCLLLFCI